MLDNLDNKTKLKTFIIFTAILILMTLILSGFTLLARKNWNNRLAENVEVVLQTSRPDEFKDKGLMVGKVVKINSTAAVSSNVYEIVNQNNTVENYALITRITTYYGPQAAVFLFNDDKGISFEGFACLKSRVLKQFENKESDIILNYWTKNAEKIFLSAGVGREDENE